MRDSLKKLLNGYEKFRNKYAHGDQSIMQNLSENGQNPETMVIACCDSRVDPALILQCHPGDLFVVRNVANIVPPYEKDQMHHGTSAALEFGINFLKVNHLIILGHSQCGGIESLVSHNDQEAPQTDFISNWVSLIKTYDVDPKNPDNYAKFALKLSRQNCLTFPWIHEKVKNQELDIHLWYFDIKSGEIATYSDDLQDYQPLTELKTE